MNNNLLESPCLFCGYNASGYWQSDTHDTSCVWHGIGGMENRMKLLPFTIKRLQKTNAELLAALEEMTSDFKAEMDSEYTSGVMMYPRYQRNYKRDKEQLDRAQEAITNAKQAEE